MTSPRRSPETARARPARWTALALASLACGGLALPAAAKPALASQRAVEPASPRLGAEAQTVAAWVVAERDARGLPFLIVDKRRATVSAFDAVGALARQRAGAARPGARRRLGARHRRAQDRRHPAARAHDARGPLRRRARHQHRAAKTSSGSTTTPRCRCTACARRRRRSGASSASPARRRPTTASPTAASTFRRRSTTASSSRCSCRSNGIVYVLPETKPLAAVFGAAATRTAQR